MIENKSPVSRVSFLLGLLLIPALLLIPFTLANRPKDIIAGALVFALLFFFPGYLLLSALQTPTCASRIFLSLVVGIVTTTSAYNYFADKTAAIYFLYFVLAISFAGILLFLLRLRPPSASKVWQPPDYECAVAGAVVALSVALVCWRSGRFSGSEFVFYGPEGQDPLFHVTLIQRLAHHIPPDNFMVSGLQAPVYHYFDDLTLALSLNAEKMLHLASSDLFDLFYRTYPTMVYFLIGALAYRLGRRWLGTVRGGILSTLLLLGGGGLGWLFGLLQTVSHISHLAVARSSLFSEWTSWDGVDPILPLVHRPAHYHSLLICLAVLNLLLRHERGRRDWIVSGLLLGLMAGFNFTLAATFGISAVLSCIWFWLRKERNEARDMAWLTVSIFFGSLPMLVGMALSKGHNPAPGFPFRGPNLEFTTGMWAPLLHRVVPGALAPLAALILFPIVAYGIRLMGIRGLLRPEIAGFGHRGIAMVFALAFALSFVIGTFFPYKALGGIAVVFIQPTLWILGLFSLRPIYGWLLRNQGNWWPIALWGILALTWVQALAAFNLSHKVVFSREAVNILQEIRSTAGPDDVIAYLPTDLSQKPLWGQATGTTNFAITAFTGLDGYVSSENYSISFAVPGLQGRNEAETLGEAKQIYEQRLDNIESFARGDSAEAASVRLRSDHVRWIVISGQNLHLSASSLIPWRSSADMVVYRLSQ